MAKDIPTRERLIFALDFPDHARALTMVDTLGDSVAFYKLGLELFMGGNYFDLVDELVRRNKKVFVDLKFFDVPETVAAAVRNLTDRGATFATVHGNDAMLEAAAAAGSGVGILAVTVLTSMDNADLADLGFPASVNVKDVVLSRAKRAIALGCAGVISSGLEAADLRAAYGDAFLIVSPGIRPVENQRVPDDQKRVVTVEQAFASGADHIVVGRPIRRADDPRAAAEAIQAQIAGIFAP